MPGRPRDIRAPKHRTGDLMIEEIEKRLARRDTDEAVQSSQFVLIGGDTPPGIDPSPGPGPGVPNPPPPFDLFDDDTLPGDVAEVAEVGEASTALRADARLRGVRSIRSEHGTPIYGDAILAGEEGAEVGQQGHTLTIRVTETGARLLRTEETAAPLLSAALPTGQTFDLEHYPIGNVAVYLNGLRLTGNDVDFSVAGKTVTMNRHVFDQSPYVILVHQTVARLVFEYWYYTVGSSVGLRWNTRAAVGQSNQIVYNTESEIEGGGMLDFSDPGNSGNVAFLG